MDETEPACECVRVTPQVAIAGVAVLPSATSGNRAAAASRMPTR